MSSSILALLRSDMPPSAQEKRSESRGTILFASVSFKFYRARWSDRSGGERDEAHAVLQDWMANGNRRGYIVTREGADYLVATLRYGAGDNVAAENELDSLCQARDLERITTAYMR